MLSKKSQPVTTQNIRCISFRITPIKQFGPDQLQIGNGIQLRWNRLQTKAAIEIRADASVQRIAGQLTMVTNMPDQYIQGHFSAAPATAEFPTDLKKCIERN